MKSVEVYQLETKRCVLRCWNDADLPAFHALNADPEVMRFFPACLSPQKSDEFFTEICKRFKEHGWGFWAIENKANARLVGFVGLNIPQIPLPFSPCVEIGWRLCPRYWGQGLAFETASACLNFAFMTLQLQEVVAFTSVLNKRSEALMCRLGMENCHNNFYHPALSDDSPLREHVLYKITQVQWKLKRAL
ncbi:hypothetical protein TDB9533_01944 [Thalassocella blandensis]|nr:hypothetical protein TDB9533_01944 [Thalassocella blandensis]